MTYPNRDIEKAADAACAQAADAARAQTAQAADATPHDAPSAPCALVVAVEPGSPADDAGFEPGCYVTSVDGQPVRDLIDWRWLADGDEIALGYIDLDGEAGVVDLWREPGEGWGLEFDDVVFDGVHQCRNACTFCFMRQLPDDVRPSLTLRDDDFRLSFLAGTFVTFTNLSEEDERRIIEQRISPLRVSLHASDPDVRRRIIGRHAQHGLDALDRLLTAGVEFHAQIVLMPGENDGDVLRDTLEWAWTRPGILDVCIVPLGFTKHQTRFERSFNDPDAARAAMAVIEPFQQRALAERGTLWAFAADEFYANAYGNRLLENLPPAEAYGDFAMFEDGVGIIRAFVDDWEVARAAGLIDQAAQALRAANLRVHYVVGEATRPFLTPLVESSPLAGLFTPLYVRNNYFGGNVDVTGLLTATDIIPAIKKAMEGEKETQQLICESVRHPSDGEGGVHQASSAATGNVQWTFPQGEDCLSDWAPPSPSPEGAFSSDWTSPPHPPGESQLFLIPRVVFNDNALTLDDATLEDMQNATGARLAVVSCNATEFLPEIVALASPGAGPRHQRS